MKKKPWPIWVLIVVFLWSAGKDLEYIFRHSTTTDYQLLEHFGLQTVFWIGIAALLTLDVLSLWCLFRPRPYGLGVLLTALSLWCLTNLTIGVTAMLNSDLARDSYVRSRQARELPVRYDALDFLFSPLVMGALLICAVLVVLVWISLLFWKRAYFNAPRTSAA